MYSNLYVVKCRKASTSGHVTTEKHQQIYNVDGIFYGTRRVFTFSA
jgi:hypothetical protein